MKILEFDIKINETIKKIEQFNKMDFYGFEGYKIGSFFVVTYDEIIQKNASEYSITRLRLKNMARCFIEDYNYFFSNNLKDRIVLFYSHEHGRRLDYVDIMQNVGDMIENSILLSGQQISKHLKIDKEAFVNLKLLRKWKKQICTVEQNPLISELLLSKLSLAFRWKNNLESNKEILSKIKILATIFDAREYENILSQFVRKLNIPTATLQHGHFSRLSEKEKYLAIPFTGFVSDKFWAWGEYAKENAIYSGLSDDEVDVVGYPKRVCGKIRDNSNVKKRFGVILDTGVFTEKTNQKMIILAVSLARNHNLELVLKPHPYDTTDYLSMVQNFEKVLISRDTMEEYALKVDFSICFASTAYIDLIVNRHIVYRYSDNDIQLDYSRLMDNDSFENIEELEDLYLLSNSDINDGNRILLLGDVENIRTCYNDAAKKITQIYHA
ncbi:hypothetical protein [Bacteroides graminisolvens]|uniref:hypothetical protein n=1 Tax=Bacteroides graminisolvens TaxID=477666 RepID=UPI0029C86B05|nr:hypothetical protein [Bacteroides graminisolvens]